MKIYVIYFHKNIEHLKMLIFLLINKISLYKLYILRYIIYFYMDTYLINFINRHTNTKKKEYKYTCCMHHTFNKRRKKKYIIVVILKNIQVKVVIETPKLEGDKWKWVKYNKGQTEYWHLYDLSSYIYIYITGVRDAHEFSIENLVHTQVVFA